MVSKHRLRLYRLIKDKARGTRDRDVRVKLELFCLAIRLKSASEACARRGFSRQFYHRWWRRFKRSGYELRSLDEFSRRPRRSPRKISARIERRILWFQRRQYGARMIEAFLSREGIRLSRSTISHVLRKRRHGPQKRKARLKSHRKRYELVIPGQRLQMDVKYVPEPVEGVRGYCYVAVDECTRWRFAKVYRSLDAGTTEKFLEALLRACPFPIHTLQTDNGQEFTYSLNPFMKGIQHPMDEWCGRHRIRHRLIPPGVKELNGKVERSHRIDEQYFYWKATTKTFEHFDLQLAKWIGFYNSQRPHGGIAFLTPLEKLRERQATLQKAPQPPLTPALEAFRVKFLRQTPKSHTAGDMRLLRLEKELEALLKAA